MSDWINRRCADCAFAVAYGSFGEGPTFHCRFGPPARGRYNVWMRVIDEAHYPIVTQFTAACSQFTPREGELTQ